MFYIIGLSVKMAPLSNKPKKCLINMIEITSLIWSWDRRIMSFFFIKCLYFFLKKGFSRYFLADIFFFGRFFPFLADFFLVGRFFLFRPIFSFLAIFFFFSHFFFSWPLFTFFGPIFSFFAQFWFLGSNSLQWTWQHWRSSVQSQLSGS